MRTFLLVLAVLAAGCAKGKPEAQRQSGDPALCDTTTAAVEVGTMTAGAGDSAQVTATGAWGAMRDGDCERITLSLLHGDGALTHAGPLHAELLRSYGLVRVRLPGAPTAVADPDSVFASPLVDAAFIVHAKDGGWYEDVHLAQPALARLVALASPGRIGIDFTPGGGAVPTRVPRARNVVVVEPRSGPATYPIVIRGYARTFEANVVARLSLQGKVEQQTHGTAADWMTTWGEFELTIPSGPTGDVELFVGEDSAQDGTPIGVTIPLTIR